MEHSACSHDPVAVKRQRQILLYFESNLLIRYACFCCRIYSMMSSRDGLQAAASATDSTSGSTTSSQSSSEAVPVDAEVLGADPNDPWRK